MELPAEALARALHSTSDWGICKICDVELPNGIENHLGGRNHFHKLRAKLNYCLPQTLAELEAFVQFWKLERGPHPMYFFNHVTLEQGYIQGHGPAGSNPDNSSIVPFQENDPWDCAKTPMPLVAAAAAAPISTATAAAAATALQAPNLVATAASGLLESSGVTPMLPLVAQPVTFAQAMNGKAEWRRWMDSPSKQLENSLFELTGTWGGSCIVCSTEMGRGAHDHLQSQSHWRLLWKKLGDQLPRPGDEGGLNKEWVQRFQTAKGDYLFNHLTGEQRHESSSSGAVMPPLADSAHASLNGRQDINLREEHQQSTVESTGAQPTCIVPLNRASIEGLMDDRGLARLRPTTTVTFAARESGILQAPQLPAAAPVVSRAALAAPAPQPNSTGDYRRALGSKQEWRTFMEGPARQAESFLWDRAQVWGGVCTVCDAEMSRGIGEHMPSQGHWKCLWNKLGQQVPAQQLAFNWEQPWVQRFSSPLGTYLFNHVTGQHGLEATLCASPTQEKHETPQEHQPIRPEIENGTPAPPHTDGKNQMPPAEAMAASSSMPRQAVKEAEGHLSAMSGAQSNQQLNGIRSAPEKFDFPAWVWQRYICTGAVELDRLLSEHENGVTLVCKVCDVAWGPSASEHLSSPSHFRCLTARLSEANREDVCTRLDAGVWVQELSVASGNTLRFNHLTGQVQ